MAYARAQPAGGSTMQTPQARGQTFAQPAYGGAHAGQMQQGGAAMMPGGYGQARMIFAPHVAGQAGMQRLLAPGAQARRLTAQPLGVAQAHAAISPQLEENIQQHIKERDVADMLGPSSVADAIRRDQPKRSHKKTQEGDARAGRPTAADAKPDSVKRRLQRQSHQPVETKAAQRARLNSADAVIVRDGEERKITRDRFVERGLNDKLDLSKRGAVGGGVAEDAEIKSPSPKSGLIQKALTSDGGADDIIMSPDLLHEPTHDQDDWNEGRNGAATHPLAGSLTPSEPNRLDALAQQGSHENASSEGAQTDRAARSKVRKWLQNLPRTLEPPAEDSDAMAIARQHVFELEVQLARQKLTRPDLHIGSLEDQHREIFKLHEQLKRETGLHVPTDLARADNVIALAEGNACGQELEEAPSKKRKIMAALEAQSDASLVWQVLLPSLDAWGL